MFIVKLALKSHLHHENIVLPFGMEFGSLRQSFGVPSLCNGRLAYVGTIRTASIRVRAVVVVGVACGVDIPRIVSVATIGRAQTAILSFSLHPISQNKHEKRFVSESCHAFMRFLVSFVIPCQYFTRFDERWKIGFARKINRIKSPHLRIASSCALSRLI